MRGSAAPAAARQSIPWLLVAAPMAVLLLFFALPNALLLSASFLKSEAQQLTNELTLENYEFLFTRPLYLWAFVRTFIVGISVGLIDVALGYPLAYFLVRTRTKWKGVLIALALAPLLASMRPARIHPPSRPNTSRNASTATATWPKAC